MTDFLQLGRPGRRRAAVVAVARAIAVIAVFLLGYFTLPVDGFNADNPTAAWIRLVVVALAFLVVLGVQVRIVVRARAPQIRAAEAVVECVVAFHCLFALLYLSMSTTDVAAFSEPLDRVDALYFTASSFATVGFGDIAPSTRLSRAVVTIQMLAGLGILMMIAKVTFYAAKQGLRRRR
jgi:voltage-gated potassium channel